LWMTSPAPRKRSATRASRPVAVQREESAEPATHPITLVVGTDTGVGKTWVSCALARALRETGQQVVAVKPIETGVTDPPKPDEDGAMLAEASGQAGPRRALIRLAAAV